MNKITLLLEQLEKDLATFQAYLINNQSHQNDNDITELKVHISKVKKLLNKNKIKLAAPLTINLPDYPDKDLEQLVFYKTQLTEIQADLDALNGVPKSLGKKVSTLLDRLNYSIKFRVEKGQPRQPPRKIDF